MKQNLKLPKPGSSANDGIWGSGCMIALQGQCGAHGPPVQGRETTDLGPTRMGAADAVKAMVQGWGGGPNLTGCLRRTTYLLQKVRNHGLTPLLEGDGNLTVHKRS